MEDVSESRGSMGELRSVLQTLSTKFQAGSDVSQIQAINVACEKLQVRRAQQLAISRDTLHR